MARSGAQYDRQKRADETAATVTGTSGEYATPKRNARSTLFRRAKGASSQVVLRIGNSKGGRQHRRGSQTPFRDTLDAALRQLFIDG